MKIALINTIRPQAGSADGITEYAYNLHKNLSKNNEVKAVYAIDQTRRVSSSSMIYAQVILRLKAILLARGDYDVIHITNQELGFVAGILKLFRSRAKVIFTVHDLMRFGKTNFTNGKLQAIYNQIVTWSIKTGIKNSDFVICSAKSVENLIRAQIETTTPITTILLGVKEEFIKAPTKPLCKRDKVIIGYVGSLTPSKNVPFILKTAECLNSIPKTKFEFRIWGGGQDEIALKEYASTHGLYNVKFMGFAPEADLLKIYESFDVCMFPTFGQGFGLPILDAQTRGLPVLALKDSSVEKEVKKYCLKVETPKEAVNAIMYPKGKGFNPKFRAKMIKHAKSFTWEKVTKQTISIYNKYAFKMW